MVVVASCAALASLWGGAAVPAGASPVASADCSAGAHTLAAPGLTSCPRRPATAATRACTRWCSSSRRGRQPLFLPGNRVSLTDRATQCLTSFSLDFERHSANTEAGPNMQVDSVTVKVSRRRSASSSRPIPAIPAGRTIRTPPRTRLREQPGRRPAPQPAAAGLHAGAAQHERQDQLHGRHAVPGQQAGRPPPFQIAKGATFTVAVNYTGTPGVHNDGDGTTEGWFRASDGGFVTTEPVGSEDWMPLNDYPAAKPTYDFSDTVAAGRTVIANGMLVSVSTTPPARPSRTARRPGTGIPRHPSPAIWSRTASATIA